MKKFRKIMTVLLILTTLTGCVKYNDTMTINSDKSMLFEVSFLLSDKLLSSATKEELNDEKTLNALKERGVSVEEKSENGYTGVYASKKYDNIDDVSNETGKEVVISDYLEEDFDDSILFKVEKGFLKNKYTAIFKFDNSKYNEDSLNFENENESDEEEFSDEEIIENDDVALNLENETSDENEGIIINYEDETSDENEDVDNDSDDDMSDFLDPSLFTLYGEMEYNFNLKLPDKALTNNATEVSEDGKTLTWALMDDKASNETSNIEFSFELKNMTNYYLIYGGIAIIAIILIIVIVSIIKKRKKPVSNQYGPVNTDNNSSVNQTTTNSPITDENVVVETPVVETSNVVEQMDVNNTIPNSTMENNNLGTQMQSFSVQTEEPKVDVLNNQQAFVSSEMPTTPVSEPVAAPVEQFSTPVEHVVSSPVNQENQTEIQKPFDMNQNQ